MDFGSSFCLLPREFLFFTAPPTSSARGVHTHQAFPDSPAGGEARLGVVCASTPPQEPTVPGLENGRFQGRFSWNSRGQDPKPGPKTTPSPGVGAKKPFSVHTFSPGSRCRTQVGSSGTPCCPLPALEVATRECTCRVGLLEIFLKRIFAVDLLDFGEAI